MPERDLVVVTGSTGFIGSALIGKLAGRFALVDSTEWRPIPRHRPRNASASI